MTSWVRPGRRRRAGAIAAFSTVPAVALTAALTPCLCPDHTGHAAMAAAPAGHHHALAHASHHTAATAGAGVAHEMRWVVGTERAPLVTRGAPGPLWLASTPAAPGGTAHGTYAAQYVARQLADRRAASLQDPQQQLRARLGLPLVDPADAVATRSALTTAEATAKLSRRCRKLLKAKRPSRLSKADRRKRAACLKQRRQLIADSRTTPTTPTPTATPAPTSPTATTPAPTTPASAATPTPTPTPAGNPCAGKNPCFAAVGVKAIDGAVPFALTRATVTADTVNFELQNTDRQPHDLYIAPTDSAGTINGPVRQIFDRTAAGVTTGGVDVPLSPGRYQLLCTVPGHGPMTVTFTVLAPQR